MRLPCRALVICVLLSALIPRQAAAERGFIEWLEKLSGPGPFKGYVASTPVFCIPFGDESPIPNEVPAYQLPKFLTWDCWNAQPDTRRLTFVVEFSVGPLVASDNRDFYGVSSADGTEVRAHKFLIATDFRVHRAVDIGFGVGSLSFEGDRFRDFTKALIQPLRVNIRPFAFTHYGRGGGWREFFVVSVFTSSVSTIRGKDFGIDNGFSTAREFNTSFGVTIDALKLVEGFVR